MKPLQEDGDREGGVRGFGHIALVSTVPYFLVAQLGGVIRRLLDHGYRVSVITSAGKELEELPRHRCLQVHVIEIPRRLSPWRDLVALARLYAFFRRSDVDVLHSTTPKAGLLCSMAARLAGVPVRLHTFTGQPWATRRGIWRKILKRADRLILMLSTHCYADSPSQRDFLIREEMISGDELSVLGHGSLGGVDIERFSPRRWGKEERKEQRDALGIGPDDFVILYLGRITKDKGIRELLKAFCELRSVHAGVQLLLVGPVDEGEEELAETARAKAGVRLLGYQPEPARIIAISDVLCLPSYREGFGTVVIEAGAMGVPTVGTRIPGLVDAVLDGETGILVPPRDPVALQGALEFMMAHPEKRKALGEKAMTRASEVFSADKMARHWMAAYEYWWRKRG